MADRVEVALKHETTGEVKTVKVGLAWPMLFAWFFGIPCFVRRLHAEGGVCLLVLFIQFVVPEGMLLLMMNSVSLFLLIALVCIGNELTAKNLLQKGFVFSEPESEPAQKAQLAWGLPEQQAKADAWKIFLSGKAHRARKRSKSEMTDGKADHKTQEHAAWSSTGSARGGEGMAMAIKSTGERLKVGESNFKRQSNSRMFLWFVLINAGIVATISIWTQGDGAVLAPFILLLGLGGAFVTLWLSRWLVTRAHSLEIIRADDDEYAWLADDVAELSRKVGLKDVPNIGVWESDDANAFAAGSSPSKAVVAFSTQLLSRLNRDEIRAVAAHEIAHVANRDMLAMTLLQGVVNAFILAVALPITAFRVVNFFSDRFSWGAEIGARVLKFVAVAFITFLGGLGVKAYSRRREFRADAMAANLVSRQHMKSALQAISKIPASQVPDSQTQFACLKIRVSRRALAEWFSTHPSIEKRINALDQAA